MFTEMWQQFTRNDDNYSVMKRCMERDIEDAKSKGSSKKNWTEVVDENLRTLHLNTKMQ